MAAIEDLVANDNLLYAKNAVETRKKHVKKVRFPDDSICSQTHQDVIAKLVISNRGSQPDDLYQFHHMCFVEPIGERLYREYCGKADQKTRNASDFLAAIKDYELSASEDEQRAIVRELVKTFLETGGGKCVDCLSDEAKGPLILATKPDSADGVAKIAGESLRSLQNGLCDSIKTALHLCKDEVISFMSKDVFGEYEKSEEFRTYLKWKYIESQPANENSFTSFRLLGRGGFGEVYAYQENLTGTIYACKKIDKKRMKKKNAESTILIEKQVLEKLNSRFVVTLYFAYESKNELNLVMTLLSGGDLKFHIYETDRKNRGVSPERCKIYSAQITLAMEHLHSENILYRDMKPENVLLDSKGNCRVADLGLAYILEDGEKIAGKAGTIGYMSPEMLNNEKYAYGVDWFALGCTIYEMCEGRGPFLVRDKSKRKVDKDKTIEKTKNDDVEYKRTHPAELIDLIGKLLAKDVNERLAADLGLAKPIFDHPYFDDINWDRMEAGLVDPPFVPSDNEIYAKDASNIKLASDAEGVKLTEEDKVFFEEFATGRNPVPWQKEILECGVYDEIMAQHASGNGPKFVPGNEEKSSRFCSLL